MTESISKSTMIEILSLNRDYVIICKPKGIPSQSDPGGDEDAMTICSRLLHARGENDTLFLIHRLDRVVGGLMVFARNKKSAAALSSLVAERDFTKEYYAIVEGKAEGGNLRDYIYKDATLGKAFITDRKRAGVKEAELDYICLDALDMGGKVYSLLKITLKTGRFHQIRAQFSSRKMPLIGDKKYGSHDFKAKMPSLFAYRLAFELFGEKVEKTHLPDLNEYPWSLFSEDKYV